MTKEEIIKPENLVYKKPTLMNDNAMHYCPGCSHGVVHKLIAEVIEEMGMEDKTVGISPVGCAVFAYNYLDIDWQEAAHGRAPAVATAVKRLWPDRLVFTYQGDGDLACIGTAETIHALNRGENITIIFINNAIYGMTGGQMAPTTLVGQVTTTSPYGRQEEHCGKPLNDTRLLALMGELEGRISGSIHYDNVAPCFLGGMQLMIEENDIISQQVPGFDEWLWVLAYPGIKVSTAEARAILPAQYRRQDCIAHGRHLAGFIHACYSRQPELAAKLMKDVIAEPYRERLLPGFRQARQAVAEIGAVASGISGSGPTLFALCDKPDTAQRVADWLGKNYLQNQEGFVHICRLDTAGARVLEN